MTKFIMTLFILVFNFVLAQESFHYQYPTDEMTFGVSIFPASNGDLLISGLYFSPPPLYEVCFISRLNDSGDVIWTKKYDQIRGDGAASNLLEFDNGDLLLVSASSSLNATVVVRMDSNGNIIWQRLFHGHSNGGGISNCGVLIAQNGHILIAGEGYQGTCVLKLDGQGNIIWTRKVSGVGVIGSGTIHQPLNSIIESIDGGFIVANWTMSTNGDPDALLTKLDNNGIIQWVSIAGNVAGTEIYRSTVQLPSESTFSAGSTASYGEGQEDLLLVKHDAFGNIEWFKTYGDSLNQYAYQIYNTGPNELTIAGQRNTSLDQMGGYGSFLLKLDTLGNIISSTKFGDSLALHNSTLDSNNQVYLIGVSYNSSSGNWSTDIIKTNWDGVLYCDHENYMLQSNNYSPFLETIYVDHGPCNFPDTVTLIESNITLVKEVLCDPSLKIDKINNLPVEISYSGGYLQITNQSEDHLSFEVFNNQGAIICTELEIATPLYTKQIVNWIDGIYYYRIYSKNGSVTGRFLKY